jgi:ribosomal protein S18 acetylase RimI-like enzyme
MNFNEFYNQFEYIYGEDIESEDADAAYKMAKKHDIAVLSDKEIYCIVKDGDEVVGALWTVFMSGEYSFDVVVRDDYQGQGIGKKLVDIAIQEYNESKEAFGDDAIMRVDVVNQDKMKPLLLKMGFKVEQESQNHTIMSRI